MVIQVNCEFCDAVFEAGPSICPTCKAKVTQFAPTSPGAALKGPPSPPIVPAEPLSAGAVTGHTDAENVSSRYRTWTYVALVFFAPVGIAMLWMKPVVKSFTVKRNLSIASGVFFLIVMITKGGDKKEDTGQEEHSAPTTVVAAQEPVAPLKTNTVEPSTPAIKEGAGIPLGYVVLTEVSVAAKKKKASGKDWDGIGPEPDPEVEVFINDQTEPFTRCPKKSDTYSNSCEPGILFNLTGPTTIKLKVIDRDAMSDDSIGESSIELTREGSLDTPMNMHLTGQLAKATITLVAASPDQIKAAKESERAQAKADVQASQNAEQEAAKAKILQMCPSKYAESVSFKRGHLKLVMEPQDATDGWRYATIEGHTVLADCAKKFDDFPALKSITVVEFAEVADKRGQVKKHKIAELKLTRKTAKKINWDNVQWKNVPKIIDKAWGKPGVAYLVD